MGIQSEEKYFPNQRVLPLCNFVLSFLTIWSSYGFSMGTKNSIFWNKAVTNYYLQDCTKSVQCSQILCVLVSLHLYSLKSFPRPNKKIRNINNHHLYLCGISSTFLQFNHNSNLCFSLPSEWNLKTIQTYSTTTKVTMCLLWLPVC